MKDHVFISYKREDLATAEKVRAAIQQGASASTWWDANLQTGGKWTEELDEALRHSAVVVVIWSSLSVTSDWVKQEASFAKLEGKLVPLRIDACSIPEPFREIMVADFSGWSGDAKDALVGDLSSPILRATATSWHGVVPIRDQP